MYRSARLLNPNVTPVTKLSLRLHFTNEWNTQRKQRSLATGLGLRRQAQALSLVEEIRVGDLIIPSLAMSPVRPHMAPVQAGLCRDQIQPWSFAEGLELEDADPDASLGLGPRPGLPWALAAGGHLCSPGETSVLRPYGKAEGEHGWVWWLNESFLDGQLSLS